MEDIRLMAFDMDGTLLDDQKRISPRNLAAMKAAQEKGVRLMLCSGRSFEALTEFSHGVGLDPVIASANGARIDLSLRAGILRESPIEEGLSLKIYRYLKETGIYFMTYTRGRSYMVNRLTELRTRNRAHVPGIQKFPGGDYETVLDPERADRECWKGTYKFICFGEDYDPRYETIREDFRDLGLSIASSWRDNLEIMNPGVDKGFAVRTVAEHFGIPLENCMVFGDNTNDEPMLRIAGWPVVMENAEACVKPLARVLAPKNTEDGVGRVIEQYVL